jgi:hypothetical protein
MPKVYRSAQGKIVDMEKLRLASEDTIAVGNMKVNARGDQLGRGGKIVKTRNQLMKEYYELNAPISKPSLEADMNYRAKTDIYADLADKSQIIQEKNRQVVEDQKNQKTKSKTKSSDEDRDVGIQ